MSQGARECGKEVCEKTVAALSSQLARFVEDGTIVHGSLPTTLAGMQLSPAKEGELVVILDGTELKRLVPTLYAESDLGQVCCTTRLCVWLLPCKMKQASFLDYQLMQSHRSYLQIKN